MIQLQGNEAGLSSLSRKAGILVTLNRIRRQWKKFISGKGKKKKIIFLYFPNMFTTRTVLKTFSNVIALNKKKTPP